MCGILLRLSICTLLTTGLFAAEPAVLSATVASATVPAGGTAQVQIFLNAPHAIVSGEIVMELDPAVFGEVLSVDVFSATGDQLGSATVQGGHLDVHFASQTGGIGRLPDLPVLVVSVPVLASAAPGKTSSPTVRPGPAPWVDTQTTAYQVNITPGTLTVGGSVSVKDVTPGGGVLPAGALVKIEGTGFTADQVVAIDGVSIASTTFVSPQEIDLTLRASTDLTGKAVRIGTRLGNILTFYSALRPAIIHYVPPGPLTLVPIVPSQLYAAALAGGGQFLFTDAGIALENPTLDSIDVVIQSVTAAVGGGADIQVNFTLPPQSIYLDSAKALGGSLTDRSVLQIIPSAPLRMAIFNAAGGRLFSPTTAPIPQMIVLPDQASGDAAPPSALSADNPLRVDWAVGTNPGEIISKAVSVLHSFMPLPVTITATLQSGGTWLYLTPATFARCTPSKPAVSITCDPPAHIEVNFDPSHLAPGVYKGVLTFASQGRNAPQPVTVPVVFGVEAQRSIFLDKVNLDLGHWVPAGTPSATVIVTSNADPISFSATTNQAWLSAKASREITPATLTISANLGGLSAGIYTGTIAVTGAAATQNITVSVEVMNHPPPPPPPVLQPNPPNLQFSIQSGQAAPASQAILFPAMFAPVTTSAQTSDGGTWLKISPPRPGGPAVVTVNVDATGLTAGTYRGTVTITSSAASGPAQVPVTLTLYNGLPPQVTISPAALTFTATTGAPAAPQTIAIATGNVPAQYAVPSPGSGPLWLSAQPIVPGFTPAPLATAITPGSATVNATAVNLPPGTYKATLTITAPPGSANSTSIPVTFIVLPAPPPPPQAGTIPIVSSVVNGAAQTSTSLSPGEIVTIFGQNIGPATPAGFAFGPEGRVATNLSGTEILFDGIAAPVLYTSAAQNNAIVPYEVSGTTIVQLRVNGTIISTTGIPVTTAAPAIFTTDSSGVGVGAVLNQDNSINSASNPAARGSTIQIYATGAGRLTPAGVTGEITGASAKRPVLPVTVRIGGVDAPVSYAASAPDAVSGLLQVNAVVPQGVIAGSLPIVLSIGTVHSQGGVTTAVK